MGDKSLQEENDILKRKLDNLKKWAIKEISSKKLDYDELRDWYCKIYNSDKKEIEKEILSKIINFLWEEIVSSISYKFIEYLLISEINYINFQENPSLDGLSVISSYHKALDIIIEDYITKWYRHYVLSRRSNIYKSNNSKLDNFLYLVIKSWYILSVWRLYNILENIKDERIPDEFFVKEFYKYLKYNSYLNDVLIEDNDFLLILKQLVESEVFWDKRHKWIIKFVETRKTRDLFLWDFIDKNCLIYKLLSIQKLDFNF